MLRTARNKMPKELLDIDLLKQIQKLWEIDQQIVDIFNEAGNKQSSHFIKTNMAKFENKVLLLKKNVHRLRPDLPKIKNKRMKKFAKNQYDYFQKALKVYLFLDRNYDADRESYARSRAKAEAETFEMLSKLIDGNMDQLKAFVKVLKESD